MILYRVKMYILLILLLPVSFISIGGCGGTGGAGSEWFLYTSTNDPEGNNIIVMSIGEGGQLTEIATVPTGGPGDADEGDFDGQYSLHIIPGTNYLLAVNAGDSIGITDIADGNGSISVYEIDQVSGLLTRIDQNPETPEIDNIDSGGVRPVSIGSAVIKGMTWVMVGNQYHNPRFERNFPDQVLVNARAGDAAGEIAVTQLRNLTAFKFEDGVLSTAQTVATYENGENGGPAALAFSPDGSKAAVTTWGVPQFAEIPDEAVIQPSRVYIYDVFSSGEDSLQLVNKRFFEIEGVAGSIGLSWSPDSQNVFVASANLAQIPEPLQEFGVTVVSTGEVPGLVDNAEIPVDGDASCWTLLTSDGLRLYVASFALNVISFFEVSNSSDLALKQSFIRKNAPLLDTKDMFITRDGKYFYVSGPLMSHTVSIYEVGGDGLLKEAPFSPFEVPSARPEGVNVSPETQAFLGLIGY